MTTRNHNKNNTSNSLIALVPDRFAHYRLTVFKALSNEDKNGFRITIYADTKPDLSSIKIAPAAYCNLDIKKGGVRWQRIHNFSLHNRCFWQSGLLKLALRRDLQVIVYWGEAHRISTWLSAILARLCGIKVIFWTHGIYGNEPALKGFIRTTFYRLADALLLYSDYAYGLLKRKGINPERMFVIKNSLDCEEQEIVYAGLKDLSKVKARHFLPDDIVLVFIGRLQKSKRLDLLIEALPKVQAKTDRSVKILIIGDGPAESHLRRLTERYQVADHIVFYGSCYNEEELGPLIAASDICVSPGEVGLTAMHALAYGTPVITHNNFTRQMPEFEAIKEGLSGGFFKYGSVNALAEKIIQCLDYLKRKTISADSCRAIIHRYYNPEYQCEVFQQALGYVMRK